MEQKPFSLSNTAELAKYIRDNKLDNDPRICALLNCVAADPDDSQSYQDLMLLLQPKLLHDVLAQDPFRPEPEANEVSGPIELGHCYETNAVFGLSQKELMQGMLVAGRPGAGKTTFCYRLIHEANRQGINCLMLDLKQDYRHLIRHLPDTLVFRCLPEDSSYLLKWNPLEPPVTLETWVPVFADVTSESYFFYAGTSSFIMSNLFRLYRKVSPEFPTLIDFKNWIEAVKMPLISRDSRYKESALNRIEAITSMAYKTLSYKRGYSIGALLKKYNVVIELDNLGTAGRNYFATLILSHIFQSRILKERDAEPVIVIVDEANEIFNRQVEKQRGDLRISSLAREAREFNLGIVASCQLPVAICDSVKNCHTRIMMGLTEGENIRNFSQSLGLKEEQKEVVWQLQPGQAIVRYVRHPNPFFVVFPPYPIEKNVSDEELALHMESFSDELGIAEAKYETHEQAVSLPLPQTRQETQQKENATDKSVAKTDEKTLLMDIYLRPYESITQHYSNLRFSAGKGNRIMKALIRKQFCRVVEISLGGRGGLTKFPEITEKACKAIEMPIKKHISRGGSFEHEFWQHKISEHLQSLGYKAEIEKNLNDKFIDIAVETEKGITAIEIAVTSEHEKVNIQKDLAAGCSSVMIACRDNNVLEEASRFAEKNVLVCPASQLLKCKSLDEIM